jgi:hypothetical protein
LTKNIHGSEYSGAGSTTRPCRSENVRSSGTKAPCTTRSWLPLPARPVVVHVSTISTSARGRPTKRMAGSPSGPMRIEPSASNVRQCRNSQSLWVEPLPKAQRPSTV